MPIGRHSKDRKRMAVTDSGKTAITNYRVIQKFRSHTHVRVFLQTGRTHQIRVHMSHINYPIVGDQVYGGRFKLPPKINNELKELLQNFKHQALHACRLELTHPISNKTMEWKAPLPDDMQQLLSALIADSR